MSLVVLFDYDHYQHDEWTVSVYVLEKHAYLYLYIYGVHFVHGYSYLDVLFISFLELM